MMRHQLESLFQEYSAERLSFYCCGLKVNVEELKTPSNKVEIYGEEISLILISGQSTSIMFKTHFDLETARRLAAHVHRRKFEQITAESAREFMKEYSSLKAGALRSAFEKSGILLGISVPFLTPGEDEIYFEETRNQNVRQLGWRLSSDLGSLVCTLEMALNPTQVQNLTRIIADVVSTDSIDLVISKSSIPGLDGTTRHS